MNQSTTFVIVGTASADYIDEPGLRQVAEMLQEFTARFLDDTQVYLCGDLRRAEAAS